MDMPKFDFSGCEFQDDSELQTAMDAANKGSKFFQPGRYEVVIDEVKYEGAAKDPNWGKLTVVYKGTGEKEQKDFLSIPFKTFKYKGDRGETLYPFKKIAQFSAALGVEVKQSNVAESMKSLFGRPEKLKGRPLVIEIGYQRAYAKYAGKDGDAAVYNLITREGTALADATGKVLTFGDREAVEAHATQEKIPFDKFSNVLSYSKSANASSVAESTSW